MRNLHPPTAGWAEEALVLTLVLLLDADQPLSSDSSVSRLVVDKPAPVVVTVLALLRAPSPLVVYAATVME